MILEIKGNLLDTHVKLIAHGVNCQNKMGAGVAKAIACKWPAVKKSYQDVFKSFETGLKGEKLLGIVDIIQVESSPDKHIANCFIQQYYGREKLMYVDYDALRLCLRSLNSFMDTCQTDEVAIPRIGSGLAGGDWKLIEKIINEELTERNVYVYSL